MEGELGRLAKNQLSLVVMNVKNVFFKSALKTFFSYLSVLNDKNVLNDNQELPMLITN